MEFRKYLWQVSVFIGFIITGTVLCGCSSLFKDNPVEPQKPNPVTMQSNPTIYSNGVQISWSKTSSENFSTYKLYVDSLSEVKESSSRLVATVVYKDSTSFTISNLLPETDYYAKVFTYNNNAASGSNQIKFTTSSCTCNVFTGEKERGMVRVPAGCYKGSDGSVATITYDFFMDTTEVTEKEWFDIMADSVVESNKPIAQISWFQTILFCNKKSKELSKDTCYTFSSVEIDTLSFEIKDLPHLQCNFSKNGFRLPTEDEWEYAYRAGGWEEFYWGRDNSVKPYPATAADTAEISQYAWWLVNNEPGGKKEVALKKPNEWSLYDMAGNVEEYIWDISVEYRIMNRLNYAGPTLTPQSLDKKVKRGGYFSGDKPYYLSAWNRERSATPDITFYEHTGFRTVRRAN